MTSMTNITSMTSTPNANPSTVFIIEDDPLMAECISRAASRTLVSSKNNSSANSPTIKIFSDAISAINALSDYLPDLIILDILLNGPDGFTFLNEIISYTDTAKIPVIIVTSLNLSSENLIHYGVRTVLNKEAMTPADIQKAVRAALQSTEAYDVALEQPNSLIESSAHAR